MEKIMVEVDRRTLVASVAALAAIGSAPTAAVAQAPTSVAPLAPAVPLPFSPASLGWLSERLIVSHHDNNYTGAVKRLSQIRGELADIDPATMAGYRLNGLKREELIAWNSMILHELYFAGLGRPSQPAPSLAQAIERDFGSLSRWAQEYAAMGKALGGGSGWVLLTWSHRDKRLVNQWAADHTMTLAGATPILALDMYEHAYALDFGSKAGDYVDGFMRSIAWDNADRVFAHIA